MGDHLEPEARPAEDGASSGRRWSSEQRLTLVATGLGLFMVFLDALIVNVTLPDIQDAFDVGEAGIQWVVAGYSLGMAAFMMSNATLADRFGRRRLYVVGLVVFALGSAGSGLAPGEGVLVVARGIQGVAAATVSVTSLALVSAVFPEEGEKARAVGLWTALAAVGVAIGPTTGGILDEAWGWRSVFFVNLPVAAVALVLTLTKVRESRDPKVRSFDPAGQVLYVLGIGLLALATIQGSEWGWLSWRIAATVVVGVVAMAAFIRVELRIDEPMTDLRLFADRTYATAIATMFVGFLAIYGTLLVVTQYFQNVEGYSALDAGLLMLPMALTVTAASPLAGRLAARYGPRRPVLAGQAILVVGLLAVAGSMSVNAYATSAALCLVELAAMLLLVPITTLAMASVPPERSGMASGIMSSQRALGSTVGYALLGAILAAWLGATLDTSLASTVPDATDRAEVVADIIDQATPAAAVAEVGAGAPLQTDDTVEVDEVVAAAADDFIRGIQVALGVAAVISTAMWFLVRRNFPVAASAPGGAGPPATG